MTPADTGTAFLTPVIGRDYIPGGFSPSDD